MVLGESCRIAARPALPIEWELNRRVAAETAAPAPEKARHARKARRRGTPKPAPIVAEAPTLFEARPPAEVIEPEAIVEAPVVEPEVVAPPVREVVIPEVLFADEPSVTSEPEPELTPDLIDEACQSYFV